MVTDFNFDHSVIVIVEKSLRGCGLGKMIMTYIEEFALRY